MNENVYIEYSMAVVRLLKWRDTRILDTRAMKIYWKTTNVYGDNIPK